MDASAEIPFTIRAVVNHVGDDVEIFWVVDGYDGEELDDEFQPYTVAKNSLYGCGTKIRETLFSLQELLSLEEKTPSEKLDPIIQRLAFDGAELYSALMSGRPGDRASVASAEEFKTWFEKTVDEMPHGNWRIQVEHKNYSDSVLPWGLVFRPPAGRDITSLSSSYEDMSGFWCTKYFLACSGLTQRENARRLRGGQSFHLGAIIEIDEREVDEYFQRGVLDDGAEKDEFSDVIAGSTKGVVDMSRQLPDANKFWYVSLNATGGSYELGGKAFDNSVVSTTDFGTADKCVGMILLDGDAVIRGDRGPDWVKKVLEVSNTGMIAVETDIKNPKLRFCGWEILRSILGREEDKDANPGEDFLRSIHRTRQEYWPLSLLYGVYSNPLHLFPAPPHPASRRISDYLNFLKKRDEEKSEK